jgi:hypothetical protein
MNSAVRLDAKRLVLGFLLSPAVAPLSAIIIPFAVTMGKGVFSLMLALTLVIGLPASYICSIIFGIPYVLIMHRRGHLNLRTIVAGALGLWAGAFALLVVACFCEPGESGMLYFLGLLLTILSLPGMLLAGVLFHRIAVR